MWNAFQDFFANINSQYGVDPLIFAAIYLGAIPCFTAAVGWVVRRLLRGRTCVLPGLMAGLFYLSSYLYVLIAGRNLPFWVYALMVVLVGTGGYFTIKNIRKRTARMHPHDTDYDLIVLGGGSAGLTAAGIGANFGAKTLLVEQDRLGGDCTWTGCVPSKALLKSAKVAHRMREADRYGLTSEAPEIDFAQVMAHVRATRRGVYDEADRPEHFEAMGVEVRHGAAHLLDEHTIEIEADDAFHAVSGRYLIIATGARPAPPPIDGLDEAPHLTSEALFELEERPDRLAILGAGPIGTEMAQAFQRLGSAVTVIDQADRSLQHDDSELAAMLQAHLRAEGVAYALGAVVDHVREAANGAVEIAVHREGMPQTITADALLLATGRRPNVEGLRLEAAGVEYTDQGITTNDQGRTSRRTIYAAGDVTGRYQFTHMSEHMAKTAVTRALLKIPQKIDDEHVPWVTYTDPELAHVGASEAELKESGARYEVYRFPYDMLDRALCESEATGLIKVFATKWTGKILGASVLGARAGELICEYALAMKHGVTLREIADTIHPYPTYGQGARRAADQWYARKQTPRLVRFIQRIFGYRGDVQEPDPDRIV